MKNEVFDRLPEGSTLRACGLSGCAALERYWSERNYSACSMIVSEDDKGTDVYFLLRGHVRAATFTASGKEVMLADIHPGENIGMFAAIDGKPRSTNIIAVEDSHVACIRAQHFNEVLETDREVLRAHLIYLVHRVRDLSARVTEVTALSARQRLAAELLRRARAIAPDDDRALVDPLPTQQELASVIFSQREAVGRDMSRMKDAGLIRRSRRTLEITSLSGLRSWIGE